MKIMLLTPNSGFKIDEISTNSEEWFERPQEFVTDENFNIYTKALCKLTFSSSEENSPI